MNTHTLKSLRGEPPWGWMLAGLACMAAMAGFFCWANAHLSAAREQLNAAQQRLALAQQDESRTIELAKRAQLALGLMREASASGLAQSAWGERRFHIKQANMSRAAANALLSEMARSRGRLFGAEEFELSVRDPAEGLFSDVADPKSMVQVSVKGSLLFKTTGEGS